MLIGPKNNGRYLSKGAKQVDLGNLKHSNKGHKSASKRKNDEDTRHEIKQLEKELPPPAAAAAAAAETGHTCQSEIYTFSHSATQTSHISPEKQIHQS